MRCLRDNDCLGADGALVLGMHSWFRFVFVLVLGLSGFSVEAQKNPKPPRANDAKNTQTGKEPPFKIRIGALCDPREIGAAVEAAEPVRTVLPLKLGKGARCVHWRTLLDRHGISMRRHCNRRIRRRTGGAQSHVGGGSTGHEPRPANFADVEQHLTIAKADVIFAAYGFNGRLPASGLPGSPETHHLRGRIESEGVNGEWAADCVGVADCE